MPCVHQGEPACFPTKCVSNYMLLSRQGKRAELLGKGTYLCRGTDMFLQVRQMAHFKLKQVRVFDRA